MTPKCIPFPSLAFVTLAATVMAADAPKPWPVDSVLPVTLERIAALPEAKQPAWRIHWEKSKKYSALLPPRAHAETAPNRPLDGPPIPATYSSGIRLRESAAWYATEDARTIADHIVQWQGVTGGWTKGGDYSRDPLPSDAHHDVWSAGTFDNDSTIEEMRFLALVSHAAAQKNDATPRLPVWRASFLRGLSYIFDSQYPNGGFPQIYPLVGSYHDAVTFNDDAMLHILKLLQDIGARRAEFAFLPPEQVALARERLDAGVRCVLACQLRDKNGRPTIWGQQHDALTLKPCAARNFEPASECSYESTGLVRFLMDMNNPDPAIVAAVEGAMDWFAHHALHGVSWDRRSPAGTGLVAKTGAPTLWARFYEFDSGRPVFGERDRTSHYDVAELSLERRNGYGWFNTAPSELLPRYATWKKSTHQVK